jgi:hypothetical protein
MTPATRPKVLSLQVIPLVDHSMCDRSQRHESLALLHLPFILLSSTFSVATFGNTAVGQTSSSSSAATVPEHFGNDQLFGAEVWAKVGERTCLRCHNKQGEARDSGFVLEKAEDSLNAIAEMARNHDAFRAVATDVSSEQSVLLQKVVGGLDHGGGQVLKPDSTGFQILERFVRRANSPTDEAMSAGATDHYTPTSFFDGVTMLTPSRLLRRVTLSLVGRLPSPEEWQAVEQGGLSAVDSILDSIMREDAFYARLKEGFNDIFLTVGIEDNAETLLSYDHFEKTRLWYQTHDFSHLPEAERERAGWKLADVYRDALLREPLELIAYIVRNERPFSELATADYIMVSPYTARGYGIYDELKDQFKNSDDPFEYIPARLHALKGRDGKVQESSTGWYPHAGFLSMFHYLRRYPSTETNRNRLRARMFYQHFLGIDVMQLAPRSMDASAVAAKFAIPTMQAADCVVCHKTLDPVAGLFQDFNFQGELGPRKEGWYEDMFPSGFEGEDLPAGERWRAAQWLAERTVKDARFPLAMVEHVYFILLGRKVLQPPEDIDDPTFGSKRRAYLEQRRMIQAVAARLTASNFNLKEAFKAIVSTEFYRADGVASATEHPQRQAELDDVGVVRLITPEQMERKLQAIFGKRWGRFQEEYKILYGGIDSITVTERNAEPSGAMGAIQRIMANDVACLNVGPDFHRPAGERKLFSGIESSVVPGDERSNQNIRETIVRLQEKLLGYNLPLDHPEVDRVFELFSGIIRDAKALPSFEPRETYFCGGREDFHVEDPHYTVRAWRGVVTYLLRQHEFLYE